MVKEMEVFENLEKAVLGSIILEPYAIREVIDDLKPKCFKKRENKLIYEVLCDMHNKSLPIDLLTISTELHNRGLLDTIGGAYYISTLTNGIVSSVHIKTHARGLIQEYLKAEAINICQKVIQDVTQPHCDVLDVFETIKKIKLYENGDCYDQHDNYLGKGKFVDGVLQVERANYL